MKLSLSMSDTKLKFNKHFFHFILILLFSACTSTEEKSELQKFEDKVTIQQSSDPKGLHPYNDSDANSTDIRRYIFQKLLTIDNETVELTPWMAKSLPTVEIINDNQGMLISYELKEGMFWPSGEPITARDVEFSFMCTLNPAVDAPHLRPYLDFLSDFRYDETNPLKFQFVCNNVYMLWDHVTGNDINIISEKFYDPGGKLKDVHLKDFVGEDSPFITSAENQAFAKNFNNVKYSRETDFIKGSGPYEFVEWQTNQRVILKRKSDWWGDKYQKENALFNAGPEKVVFETINDMTTAITALKGGKIDVIPEVRSTDWIDLPNSKKFMANYDRHELDKLSYIYLGMNVKNPMWRGQKTRLAMAHLIEADQMIETLLNGLGRRTVGPIHPILKNDYNSEIEPYPYDMEKAKKLLAEDGWEDKDGDGILDKVIDGKRRPLKLDFVVAQGSTVSKNFALMVKESARRAGLDISISSVEWSVYLERKKAHELDLWLGSWRMDPRPSDPVQIWHTKSANGGSNDSSFGNAESDAMIAEIRRELDPQKRSKLYHEWQTLLHQEVPYVFLFATKRKLVMHKRFENMNFGVRQPGFWGGGLQVKSSYK